MLRHMRLSVRGALRKSPRHLANTWGGAITDDAGKVLKTSTELQEFFMDQLAMGRECLPCGDCDNFDFKAGCKGHDEATHAK